MAAPQQTLPVRPLHANGLIFRVWAKIEHLAERELWQNNETNGLQFVRGRERDELARFST